MIGSLAALAAIVGIALLASGRTGSAQASAHVDHGTARMPAFVEGARLGSSAFKGGHNLPKHEVLEVLAASRYPNDADARDDFRVGYRAGFSKDGWALCSDSELIPAAPVTDSDRLRDLREASREATRERALKDAKAGVINKGEALRRMGEMPPEHSAILDDYRSGRLAFPVALARIGEDPEKLRAEAVTKP